MIVILELQAWDRKDVPVSVTTDLTDGIMLVRDRHGSGARSHSVGPLIIACKQ
jgi:hypothetical protein